MQIKMPYGKDMLEFDIPEKNLLYCAPPMALGDAPDREALTAAAFGNPIGAKRLEEMVRPGMKIALLVDDVAS